MYSQGAASGIFMFDLTRRGTLSNIENWIKTFKEGLSAGDRNIPIMLVGGKSDLKEKRSVDYKEALEMQKSLAKSNNLFEYIECSSKTGEKVDELFERLISQMMKGAQTI